MTKLQNFGYRADPNSANQIQFSNSTIDLISQGEIHLNVLGDLLS